jgi:putative transposase
MARQIASLEKRLQQAELIIDVQNLAAQVGRTKACASLGVRRMTEFRQRNNNSQQKKHTNSHPRALLPEDRAEILCLLGTVTQVDKTPAAVYAQLLDQGQYICSVRTMYRILRSNKAVQERRNLRRHPIYKAPELVAHRPNEV